MDVFIAASAPICLNMTSATIRTMSNAPASLAAYKHLDSQLPQALSGLESSTTVAATAAAAGLGHGSNLSKLQSQLVSSAKRSSCGKSGGLGVGFPRTSCSSKPALSMQTNAASVLVPSVTPLQVQVPDIASRWRELHGSNYWKGLLHPLDPDLRTELIRYGDFVQVAYDSFDNDRNSVFYGSNRYCKENLFEKVYHLNTGYEVTQYIYATTDFSKPKLIRPCTQPDAWSRDSNWMGYVAVCTDKETIKRLGRRDIVINWRGTIVRTEWAADAQIQWVPPGIDPRPAHNLRTAALRVETGFLNLYKSKDPNSLYNKTSARQQVLTELKRLIEMYKGEQLSISIAGHSLGSALATLNAYDIAKSGLNRNYPDNDDEIDDWWPIPENWSDPTADPVEAKKDDDNAPIPIAVFSYAGPRVGNSAFVDELNALGVKVLRVVNVNDIVPRIPGSLLPPQLAMIEKLIDALPFTYSHAGVQLLVNNFDSQVLDPKRSDIFNCHNLQGYLHLISNKDNEDEDNNNNAAATATSPRRSRDLALVNKSSNFLKDQHGVPPSWWQIAYKGLAFKKSDGTWIQEKRADEDIPVPP